MPWFVLGVGLVAFAAWAAADWLVHRPWSGGPADRVPVVVAAPLLGAVLSSLGLGGADEELEGSTAARWRFIRLTHIVLATALLAGALALTGLWEPRDYGALELARNALGFMGMIAAATAVLGARLAWAPAFGYAAVVYIAAPKPIETDTAWWTWPLQPWSAGGAGWAAGVLFAGGLAWYVASGARKTRDLDG